MSYNYSDLPFPQISLDVWEEKYKWANEQTPEDTMRRVANALEVNPEPLVNFEFIPGGRIIAGAGTNRKVTYLNCAVLPEIEDSMEGIGSSVKELMLWLKNSQGVGTDFSSLRPAGTQLITNEGAIASGPLSFMQLWDTACKTIMSGGARRGALMGTLRCDHPDIESFIVAKRTAGNLTQFNLSVLCTDDFMRAVQQDLDWKLQFKGVVYKTIRARTLWELIMQNTYEFAEPGVIFIDTIQKQHRIPSEKIITTNPCGEIPLPAHGVCCLGAVNLLACISEPFTEGAGVNELILQRAIRTGINALNSVIEKTPYACPEQEQLMKQSRRIGLGVMGLGSACNALGMSYVEGAKLLLDRFKSLVEKSRTQPIITTIAPTGNTGVFAKNVSGGIEPVFALEYKRNKREVSGASKEYTVRDASVELFRRNAVPNTEEYLNLMQNNIATKLPPEIHLEVQAYAQRFIDNSISKTINCPIDISYEDFKNIYTKAYELGCKGCTTYRPSAVRGAVLESVEEESVPETAQLKVAPAPIKPSAERPEVLDSVTAKFFWPPHERAYYITLGSMEDLPYECFINSKSVNSELIALARLASAQFRRANKVSDIAFVWEELQQVGGNDEGAWVNGRYHKSLIAAIGSIVEELADHIILEDDDEAEIRIQEEVEYERENAEAKSVMLPQCPKCGQYAIISESGCEKCLACGYSKCS